MIHTRKSVARLSGIYFFSLLGTNIFLHATFMMQLSNPVNFHPTIDLNAELALLETRAITALAVEPFNPIVIEHEDITGLKSMLPSKPKTVISTATSIATAIAEVMNPQKKLPAPKAQPQDNGNLPDIVSDEPDPTYAVNYAAVFDSLNAPDIRLKAIAEAKKHLGLRYVYAGASPRGFDCSGFTSYVLGQQGVGVSRSSSFQSQQGAKIPLEKAQTGDLIFFSKHGKGGRVTHVAMVVDNKEDGIYVIHSTRRGIVVDNLMKSSYWRPKILYAKDVITKEFAGKESTTTQENKG